MQLRFKEESVDTLKHANEQYREKAQALEDELSARQTQIELLNENL